MDEFTNNNAVNSANLITEDYSSLVENPTPRMIASDEYANGAKNIINAIMGSRSYDNAWSANQAAVQRDWSSSEADKTRYFNMIEASKNREWQSYMSNTAHMRETRDLIAAGLNPILSAMGGNGAAVGSGSAASASMPSGASANGNQSTGMAMAEIFATLLSNQERMNETLLNAQLTREENEKTRNLNESLGILSSNTQLQNAMTSANAVLGSAWTAAQAAMYGYDLNYLTGLENRQLTEKENSLNRKLERERLDLTKYGYDLNYDVGMKNAGVYQQMADIQRKTAEAQIQYWAGLLMNAGYDRATSVEVARIYAEATKKAASTNAGAQDLRTVTGALLALAGSLTGPGAMNPIGFGY